MSQCLETPVLIMMPRSVKRKKRRKSRRRRVKYCQKEGPTVDFLNCVPGHRRAHDMICLASREVIKPGSVQSGEIYMRGVAAHVRPRLDGCV